MKILYGQVPILFFVTTNGLVALLDVESIDDFFSYSKELVLWPTRPSCYLHDRHFKHIDKLLANGVRISESNKDVIGNLATQTKEET